MTYKDKVIKRLFEKNLFLGTYKDNNKDCVKKGRHIPGTKVNVKKGVEAGNSKLTESEVREIRKRIAAGESTRKVAKDFGISSPAVSKIARRETWAHID